MKTLTTKDKPKPKDGEEKHEALVQTWLKKSTQEELRKFAEKEERSIAQIVRMILERALASDKAFKEAMGR